MSRKSPPPGYMFDADFCCRDCYTRLSWDDFYISAKSEPLYSWAEPRWCESGRHWVPARALFPRGRRPRQIHPELWTKFLRATEQAYIAPADALSDAVRQWMKNHEQTK